MRYIKIGETVKVYFDVRLTDNQTPALSESGGQPQQSLNGAGFDNLGLSTLIAVGYGRYYSNLNTNLLSLAVGDVIKTRYKGVVTAESFGDDFTIVATNGTLPDENLSIKHYGTIFEADLFFSERLNVKKWTNSNSVDKRKSLIMGTQIIDRLNFAGDKANAGQVLQFPRSNTLTEISTGVTTTTKDDNVPIAIEQATYLVAYKLLEGFNPDYHAEMLAVEMSKYQSVQTYYDREYIPDFMVAGIPSSEAWNLLRPYLRDPNEINFSRV